MKKLKLRTIILIEVCTVLIVGMGIFAIYASWKYQKSNREETYAITRFYTRNVIDEMDDYFYELDNVSFLAFYQEDLIQSCKDFFGKTAREQLRSTEIFNQATTEMLILQESLQSVVLYNAEGKNTFAHSYHPAGDEALNNQIKNNQELIDIFIGSVGDGDGGIVYDFFTFGEDEAYIFAVRQLRTFRPHEVAGYIVFISPVSVFEYILANDNDISNVLVLNQRNQIVYESSGEWIGISAEEFLPGILNIFAEGQNGYYEASMEEKRVLISGGVSSYSGWKIVVIQDADDVYAVSNAVTKALVVMFLLVLFLTMVWVTGLISHITRPLIELSTHLSNLNLSDPGEEIHDVEQCREFAVLTGAYNAMLRKINQMLEQEYKAVIREKEYQLSLLRTQVKPHFLYNTLDTIRMSAVMNNDCETANMVLGLSDFFRKSVTHAKVILLEEEFSQAESYISLLKLRYSGLHTNINLAEELRYEEIPGFVLQPLIENAFLHGLKSKKCAGTIWVTAEEMSETQYVIIVRDDGIGASPEVMRRLNQEVSCRYGQRDDSVSHIGLGSVSWRLNNFFGERCHMEVDSQESCGFCVKITISDL